MLRWREGAEWGAQGHQPSVTVWSYFLLQPPAVDSELNTERSLQSRSVHSRSDCSRSLSKRTWKYGFYHFRHKHVRLNTNLWNDTFCLSKRRGDVTGLLRRKWRTLRVNCHCLISWRKFRWNRCRTAALTRVERTPRVWFVQRSRAFNSPHKTSPPASHYIISDQTPPVNPKYDSNQEVPNTAIPPVTTRGWFQKETSFIWPPSEKVQIIINLKRERKPEIWGNLDFFALCNLGKKNQIQLKSRVPVYGGLFSLLLLFMFVSGSPPLWKGRDSPLITMSFCCERTNHWWTRGHLVFGTWTQRWHRTKDLWYGTENETNDDSLLRRSQENQKLKTTRIYIV